MKNCTITIDVTSWGYTALLSLANTLADFLEDGDNEEALDTLYDWIGANAREFIRDARANKDWLAIDLFEGIMAEEAEEEDLDEGLLPENLDEDEEEDTDEDTRTGVEMYADMAVQAYLDRDENGNIEHALQANAIDVNNEPGNLFRAGVFEGLAEATAWAIYQQVDLDDINAIKAAIYRAYRVAW